MKWRTRRTPENAGDTEISIAARPPEAAYGRWVHCGFCSTTHDTSTLYLHPRETHIQCGICGKLVELPLKAVRQPNPYVEHGPGLTPAA